MCIIIALTLFLVLPVALTKFWYILTHRNCKSKVCLVGKTALVTGGNTGIGYEIVLALAQRGCRVIIANRTRDQHLLDNIYKETQSRNIVFKYVDLSSFKSVRELANSVIEDEGKLDILIHNAGMAQQMPVTEDGLDAIMQVNYFSAVLLTQLLEDILKKTRSRIIFTSSGTSYFFQFTIDKLDEISNTGIYPYPKSKLCLIMISEIFAEKFKKYGVTSNTYHPGLVHTNIFKRSINPQQTINLHWIMTKLLEYFAILAGKTAEEGAQTAIYLACANEVEGITGEYFCETKPTLKPKPVYDKKMCQAIWEATEKILKSKLN